MLVHDSGELREKGECAECTQVGVSALKGVHALSLKQIPGLKLRLSLIHI